MSFLQHDVPLSWYLLLSAILFSLGVVGFLIKRNLITVFMSIELMLNAVNLSFRRLFLPMARSARSDLRLFRHDGRRR